MVRRATRFVLLLLFLGAVGCDQGSKLEAKLALQGHAPLDLVRGVIDLRYAENRDTAFSLFQQLHLAANGRALLAGMCLALIAISALWWKRRRASALEHAGFALVVAGALGNVADRIARGYVVDFIHVAHWPVFNVADALITVGAILLVLARRPVSGTRPA